MEQKTTLIRIGDFLFKYRNLLFPVLLIGLFLIKPPAYAYFGDPGLEYAKDAVAIAIILAGLGLRAAVIGFKYIKRGGLNKKVYAENLVTDGFFAVCRNPLYVGNMIIYFGVLLMHGSPTVLLIGTVVFAFIYTAIIAAEEYFLRGKFGEAYEAYCRDVPRWRMHFSRLKGATEGMQFNFKRVIAKDYSTIFNAVIAVVGLELWEELEWYPGLNKPIHWELFLTIIVVFGLITLSIRVAKKRGLLSV